MEETKKTQSPMAWVLGQTGDYGGQYVLSVVLAVIGVAFSLAPYFVVIGIVQGLMGGVKDFSFYLSRCLIMAAFWLGRVLFHALSTSTSHKATFAVLGEMRKRCMEKLTRMPLGTVLEQSSGALKNTLIERIDSIETTLAHIVPEFTANLLIPIIILIYIFTIDWRMGLASLATVPLGMFCYVFMMAGSAKFYQRTVTATKALNDTAVEYIGGIQVIKVFGKTKSSYERFVHDAYEAAHSFIDCLSAQDFVTVIILSVGVITPIVTMMSYSDDFRTMGTIFGEVRAILDAPEMNRPSEGKAPAKNDLELRDVHFGYQEKEVLHGVSMIIPEGSFVAFVGPSGSGKSTIARLIASLWDVTDGSIRMGGQDIRQIPQEAYADRIAFVSQDNYLFNMTVRENIRIGRPSATDAEVEEAARQSGCHEFIMSLEEGYDTLVGSSGGHLSGGERQRISIARAMLKAAPVVILDEATAYTDPENEAVIQRSVSKLTEGKTLIVIAHRLSTVMDADRIYVIRDGVIDDQGTHEELLRHHGLYEAMWNAHMEVKDNG